MSGFNVVLVAVCTFSDPDNLNGCQVAAMAESCSKKEEEPEKETDRRALHGGMKRELKVQDSEPKWIIFIGI